MAWFKRDKKSIEQTTPPEERRVRTEGLWVKCESCRTIVFRKDLEANLHVCPKCQFHFKMNSKQRLEILLDGRWTEHDAGMTSTDPLKFVDTKPYATRLREAKKKLGMNDAVITAEGQLNGRPVVMCSMEFGFIGGVLGFFGEVNFSGGLFSRHPPPRAPPETKIPPAPDPQGARGGGLRGGGSARPSHVFFCFP